VNHITFGLFTPAVLAGAKTVTRRDWPASKAREFAQGDLVWAYDRSPDEGGTRVGIVRLTHAPVLQKMFDMPTSDFEAEGFIYLAELYRSGLGAREPEFSEFYKALRRSIAGDTGFGANVAHREPALEPVAQMRHLVYAWVNRGGWRWVLRFELAKVLDREVLAYGDEETVRALGAARGVDLADAGERGSRDGDATAGGRRGDLGGVAVVDAGAGWLNSGDGSL
jgi:hypothetical protein